ncbi:MAG: hypothetical protein U0P45_14995 [Acidimicrobiales bacterium]
MPDSGGGAADSSSGSAKSSTPSGARYLYQKVQVLAVDKDAVGDSVAAQSGDGAAAAPVATNSGMLTLIVPPKAAQILASFPPNNLYFTLVGRDYKPVAQDPVDLSTLPGEDPGELTPYGPEGARTEK